jgi:hypothetical protein
VSWIAGKQIIKTKNKLHPTELAGDSRLPEAPCFSVQTGLPLFLVQAVVVESTECLASQSQSDIMADGQSVCMSWCRAHSGTYGQTLLPVRKFLFCLWGHPL